MIAVRNAIDKALAERDGNLEKFCISLDKDIALLSKEVKKVKQEAQVCYQSRLVVSEHFAPYILPSIPTCLNYYIRYFVIQQFRCFLCLLPTVNLQVYFWTVKETLASFPWSFLLFFTARQ